MLGGGTLHCNLRERSVRLTHGTSFCGYSKVHILVITTLFLKYVLVYSDDGERYDSDGEGGTQTKRGREYRDKDSDSLDSTEKRDRNGSKPSTPARTKPTTSVKKIDLGAAVHYGKDPHSLVSCRNGCDSSIRHVQFIIF
jgi:hypothetical protein